MDLDDEGRGYGGEQTGLRSKSARAHPSSVHNLRISVSCSDPRHASSWIPCHSPRPPCGNARRIGHGNLPAAALGPFPFCAVGERERSAGCAGELTRPPGVH